MLLFVLKILFRLIFGFFSNLHASLEPQTAGKRATGQTEIRAEVVAQKVSHGLSQALGMLENTLAQQIDTLAEGSGTTATAHRDTLEIDELHAQIAELKADLRVLHRVMAEKGTPFPPPGEG